MLRSTLIPCAGLVLVCAGLVGCGTEPTDGTTTEQVLGYTPSAPSASAAASSQTLTNSSTIAGGAGSNTSYVELEPNDTWQQAEPIDFAGYAEIRGTMSAGADRKDADIFDLGPAQAGEHVYATLTVASGTDTQIGLFDESNHLLAYIDPASVTAGPWQINIVLRSDTSHLYVMVATRSTSSAARDYTARVSIDSNGGTPAPAAQAVRFVFHGAQQVQIGTRNPTDVPVFDVAGINAAFAGRTQEVIDLIMARVREDYAGLNVQFFTDDDYLPVGDYSSVYFGTSDTRLLGLADNIDPYNTDTTQSAIIYTDTFSLFNTLRPTLEDLAQVLANTASHETGHLLGLRHAADAEELMDVTASARQMMRDQWFKISTLHASVLPMGLQDAPTMLSCSVGGALAPRPKLYAARTIVDPADDPEDFYIPRSWLESCGQ